MLKVSLPSFFPKKEGENLLAINKRANKPPFLVKGFEETVY